MIEMAESAGTSHGALEHAALTDVGLRRANNQDAFAIVLAADDQDARRQGNLLMVADGMGAHAAGELASKIACESLPHTYRKLVDRPPADALRQAVLAANASIHERGQANAEFQGMGTTCSVLLLLPHTAIVAHVGDSRVYRLRGRTLDQLTFDHSLVWEMLAAGQMPRGEAASFIPKNIITRSLGPHADVQVDLEGPFPLEVGDTFLLCSDGLSGQVKDEEIGPILAALSPSEAVRLLVDMANLRGGPDNITALVAHVLAVPAGNPELPPPIVKGARPSAHPALWCLLALCGLIAVGLAGSGYYVGALISGLLAVATGLVGLVQNTRNRSAPAATGLDGPFGSGPHTSHDGVPRAESVAVLCQMAQQLREAAKDEHWTLDWGRFNGYCEQAQTALAAADFKRAVRQYALAISFMMSELRRRPPGKDQRDSTVLDL
jgi:protein phosphatase